MSVWSCIHGWRKSDHRTALTRASKSVFIGQPNDPIPPWRETRRTGRVDGKPDKRHRDLADSTASAMAGLGC